MSAPSRPAAEAAPRVRLEVSNPARLLRRLAGLSVLERQLFTLARAGAARVDVGAPKPGAPLRLPRGLEVRWDAPEEGGADAALSAEFLVRPRRLKEILARPGAGPVLDRDGRTVLRFASPSAQGPALALGAQDAFLLDGEAARAERWLLDGARKAQDGFMARHFDRAVSLAITRRLLESPLTPNQMTLLSLGVGLLGCALLSSGERAWQTAGAAVVWAHTLLDGCDGEMARLRFQESRLGALLDFWGDNAVHAALFLCLGLGAAPVLGRLGLVLGLVAAAAALASARLLSPSSGSDQDAPAFEGLGAALPPVSSPAGKRLADLEDALARRDFIYLLVPLAALGWLPYFLWAAALGTPLFLAGLLWLRTASRRHEAASQGGDIA